MNYLFIILSFIIFIIIFYIHKFYKYDKHKFKLHGPLPFPIIGNLHQIGTISPQLKLSEYSIKYNHIFRMWFGDQYSVIVSDPKLIREMFIDNFESFNQRPYSAKLAFGNQYHGTTTGCGEYWVHNRDIVSRALRKSSNKVLYEFLDKKVCEFIEMIEKKFKDLNISGVDDNEFIVLERPRFYIQRFTISIMFKFIFNEDIPFSNENEQDSIELQLFFKTIKDIFKLFSASTLIDFISFLQPIYFKYLKQTDKLFPKIFNLINNKYQQHLKYINFNNNYNNNNNNKSDRNNYNNNEKDNRKPKDLLEALIYEYGGNNPTKSEIQSVLSTSLDFFLAGSETSSTAIEWIILMLINHNEYQERIYNELKSINKFEIKLHDKVNTPLINSFIKETLRLHPPAPFGLPHLCTEDVLIDNKYFIPKGSQIIINFKGLAYNENYFKNSKSFIGDRFVNSKIENDSFLTFGVGLRNCVGSVLAMDEIYLFISNLLLKYQLSSIDGKSIDETEKVRLNLNNKKFNFKISKRI